MPSHLECIGGGGGGGGGALAQSPVHMYVLTTCRIFFFKLIEVG